MDEYKSANLLVANDCRTITELLLVNIDGKRVYDNLEFEEEQVLKFVAIFVEIFQNDSRI